MSRGLILNSLIQNIKIVEHQKKNALKRPKDIPPPTPTTIRCHIENVNKILIEFYGAERHYLPNWDQSLFVEFFFILMIQKGNDGIVKKSIKTEGERKKKQEEEKNG